METCICNFCQKALPNDNSKRNHERLCKLNPKEYINLVRNKFIELQLF